MDFLKLKLAPPSLGSHVKGLDGFRGIAISLVLINHCLPFFPFQYFSYFGWVGVELFFVLSGFLITRILMNSREDKAYFRNFIIRRALRIFPLYYLFLTVFLCFVLFSGDPELVSGLFSQVYYWTYTQNFFLSAYGWPKDKLNYLLAPFWSLAIEEQYYLFWPFVIWLLSPKNVLRCCALLLGVCLLMRNLNPVTPFAYVFTFAHLDGLLIGSALSVLMKYRGGFLEKYILISTCSASVLLILVFLINHQLLFSNPLLIRGGYTLISMVFGGGIILLFHCGRAGTVLRCFMENPVLTWLGKYSYGIYVYHLVVYTVLKPILLSLSSRYLSSDELNNLVSSFASLAAVFLISYLSYQFYEKRFLELKKKLTSKKHFYTVET